jgi:hypothetical protein
MLLDPFACRLEKIVLHGFICLIEGDDAVELWVAGGIIKGTVA